MVIQSSFDFYKYYIKKWHFNIWFEWKSLVSNIPTRKEQNVKMNGVTVTHCLCQFTSKDCWSWACQQTQTQQQMIWF